MKAQHVTVDPEVSRKFLFSPSSESYVCCVYNVQDIQLYFMERISRWSRSILPYFPGCAFRRDLKDLMALSMLKSKALHKLVIIVLVSSDILFLEVWKWSTKLSLL